MDFKKGWKIATERIKRFLSRQEPATPTYGPQEKALRAFAESRGLTLHILHGASSSRVMFSGGILIVKNHKAVQPHIFGDGHNNEHACAQLIEQIRGQTIAVGPPPDSRVITVPETL